MLNTVLNSHFNQALVHALAAIPLILDRITILRPWNAPRSKPEASTPGELDHRHFDMRSHRLALLAHNPHCVYCGTALTDRQSTLDHLVPICRGGLNEARNLALCCNQCNKSKSYNTPSEWRDKLLIEAKRMRRIAKKARQLSKLTQGIPVSQFIPVRGMPCKTIPLPVDVDNQVWHLRDFRRGRNRYSITERSTGRVIARNLSLGKAVQVYQEIGTTGDTDDIEMTVSAVMHTEALGMIPGDGVRSTPMAP